MTDILDPLRAHSTPGCVTGPDGGGDPCPVDPVVFGKILALGDRTIQQQLLAQLGEDFSRLAGALATPDARGLAAVAHEIKGLAATIGAKVLAQGAETLNSTADLIGAPERQALAAHVQRETHTVLRFILEQSRVAAAS